MSWLEEQAQSMISQTSRSPFVVYHCVCEFVLAAAFKAQQGLIAPPFMAAGIPPPGIMPPPIRPGIPPR